jgi:hypothetical protein
MEIIDNGQTTILPSILILENMFLANETIDWARRSNQPLVQCVFKKN